MEEVDRFGGKAGRRAVVFGVLDAGTKDRVVPGMRGILGSGMRKVLKYVQGFWNVGWNGKIAGASSVVPGEGEFPEEVGRPID